MKKGTFSLLKFLSVTITLACMVTALSVFSINSPASAASSAGREHLEKFGIQGNIAASTYGHNPNGFMARVDGKNYIVDLKNDRVASIENPDSFFDELLQKREKQDGLAIVQFLVRNDRYDKDNLYGEWRGNHHLIPMYILFDYDANGNALPEGRIFSGEGASPGHYHGDIHEQKNIDLAKLFLDQGFLFAEQAGFSAAAVSKWPGNYPGTITGNEVNVRTGPGTDYRSLGVFFKGDNITLLNRTEANGGIWYEVKYYNTQFGWIQGWVYGDFIEEN